MKGKFHSLKINAFASNMEAHKNKHDILSIHNQIRDSMCQQEKRIHQYLNDNGIFMIDLAEYIPKNPFKFDSPSYDELKK